MTHCLIISSVTSILSSDLIHAYIFSMYFPFTSSCNPHVLFLTSTVVPPVTLCTSSFCKLPVLLPVLLLSFSALFLTSSCTLPSFLHKIRLVLPLYFFLFSSFTSSCPPLVFLPVLLLYFLLSSLYTSSCPPFVLLPVILLYFFLSYSSILPLLHLYFFLFCLIFFLPSLDTSSFRTPIFFLPSLTIFLSFPYLPLSSSLPLHVPPLLLLVLPLSSTFPPLILLPILTLSSSCFYIYLFSPSPYLRPVLPIYFFMNPLFFFSSSP